MELPKQFDNITSHVIDDLKVTLRQGSKVSMAAASFSIYAFEALQKELEKVDELRFIFTSPTFNKEEITLPNVPLLRSVLNGYARRCALRPMSRRCRCQVS